MFSLASVAETKPRLTFAIPFNSDVPPYLWRNNEGIIVGGSRDVQELIARKLGYAINWRFYHYIDGIDNVAEEYRKGKIDEFINTLPKSIKRDEMLNSPTGFPTVTINGIIRAESPQSLKTIDDIIDQRGVLSVETIELLKIVEGAHHLKAKIHEIPQVEDLRTAVDMVISGEADYTVAERYMLLNNAFQWKLIDQLQVVQPPLGHIETIFWFSPESPFVRFQSQYRKLSQQFSENGQFDHIVQSNMRRYIRLRQTPSDNHWSTFSGTNAEI